MHCSEEVEEFKLSNTLHTLILSKSSKNVNSDVCVCVCACVCTCTCVCVCVCVHVSHEPLPLTPPVTGCMSGHTAAMGWQSSRYIAAMPAHAWPQYRVTRT